jgi:hypothetical protein
VRISQGLITRVVEIPGKIGAIDIAQKRRSLSIGEVERKMKRGSRKSLNSWIP